MTARKRPRRFSTRSKVQTLKRLKESLKKDRRQGRKIVFTNGCFDIVHLGHLRYLSRARKLGDRLVVGINSDASVRKIKPPPRPILSQSERAELLAGFSCVDYVTIFSETDPYRTIAALKPDVLVKGSDWSRKDIIGRELVEDAGGVVRRVPLVKGYSTTRLVEKIRQSR
ncbi:MAG TPA: D-glycero-beta-D-manno-heptose 1-phosphate adenylyltransferase [Nitrospiria bacterium]|nr:D-glycero-beta-D-manno-heptose 1-phosphate adenylyltransferase [Nitrospiria bacterium]